MWSVPSRLSVYANAVLTAAGRASNPTHFPPGSRCAPNLTLNVVVISSNGEGDRSVESLEVKVPEGWTFQSDPYRGASNLAGCSGSEPVKPRNRPPAWNGLGECRECRAGGHSAKANVGIEVSGWISMSNSPGSERTACQEGMCSESPEPLAGRFGAPAQRRHRV